MIFCLGSTRDGKVVSFDIERGINGFPDMKISVSGEWFFNGERRMALTVIDVLAGRGEWL